MKQARSIAYPVPSQINTFSVTESDGMLRQLFYDAAGNEHKVNINILLGLKDKFDPESPPTFATTANGDLVVFVYGTDGTANAIRFHLQAAKWTQTVIGGY